MKLKKMIWNATSSLTLSVSIQIIKLYFTIYNILNTFLFFSLWLYVMNGSLNDEWKCTASAALTEAEGINSICLLIPN